MKEIKNKLRKKAKEIRCNLPMDKISKNLCKLIRQHPVYKNAENVMLFYPKENEVDLLELLIDNKNFYLPRVNSEHLEICPYKSGDKLNISAYKIYEPLSADVNINNLDLILVPALMADKNGYRLGYGKGFYDRLLVNQPTHLKTIIPIAKELLTSELPHSNDDIKCDYVISC